MSNLFIDQHYNIRIGDFNHAADLKYKLREGSGDYYYGTPGL
jgi:hypothetical protein